MPVAMGYGVLSGLGPVAGMYGAVAVGIFASLFGGNRGAGLRPQPSHHRHHGRAGKGSCRESRRRRGRSQANNPSATAGRPLRKLSSLIPRPSSSLTAPPGAITFGIPSPNHSCFTFQGASLFHGSLFHPLRAIFLGDVAGDVAPAKLPGVLNSLSTPLAGTPARSWRR